MNSLDQHRPAHPKEEKKTEATENSPNEYLGKKKIRLTSIIAKIKEQSEENSSGDDTDRENDQYKNLFSGKLNIKNALMEEISGTKSERWTPSVYVQLKDKKEEEDTKTTMHTNETQDLLNILPPPKVKLKDKNSIHNDKGQLLSSKSRIKDSKYTNLNNPDCQEVINSGTNNPVSDGSSRLNDSSIIELRQSDLIDNNWEREYLKDQTRETIDERHSFDLPPAFGQKNKNNIREVIKEYVNTKELPKKNVSKYGKITTKKTYGW